MGIGIEMRAISINGIADFLSIACNLLLSDVLFIEILKFKISIIKLKYIFQHIGGWALVLGCAQFP